MEPFQAALYLMTRIPYWKAFANGNKRTVRLAANNPLVGAGLLSLSFADVDKTDYIRAMAALCSGWSSYLSSRTAVRWYAAATCRSACAGLVLVRAFIQTAP